MLAIRIQGISKYFGASLDLSTLRPGEARRALLSILGIRANSPPNDGIQRVSTTPGQVLQDSSLDIEAGSVVCLTGDSGSGKSVLLKILAGVLSPTTGRVELHGTVSSLLAIGDNLDGRLTAYENIENYRRLLRDPGAPQYADDVIAFAELHGFERAPVRTYSTGMTLRLSVALALSGNPSILLIDDVLRVGDIAFQRKCLERLQELRESGCTLVAAFSDEMVIQQVASRVITLTGGRITGDSPPKHWRLDAHLSGAAQIEWRISSNLPEDDVCAFRSISVENRRERNETYACVSHAVETKVGALRCRPSVFIMRDRMVVFRSLYPQYLDVDDPCCLMFTVMVPTHMLADGDYRITSNMLAVHNTVNHSLKAPDAVALRIRRNGECADPPASMPLLAMTVPWEIERVMRQRA